MSEALAGIELERVHEIGVQAFLAGRDARQHGMRPSDVERVPAHMRDFEARDRRDGSPRHRRESSRGRRRFHARARASPSTACRRRCRGTAGRGGAPPPRALRPFRRTASRPRRQSAKAPTPGSTIWSARGDRLGIGRDQHLAREPRLARGALEGLVGRVQIARPVIDDGDVHLASRLREEADDFMRAGGSALGPARRGAARRLGERASEKNSRSAVSKSAAATISASGSPRRAKAQPCKARPSIPMNRAASHVEDEPCPRPQQAERDREPDDRGAENPGAEREP